MEGMGWTGRLALWSARHRWRVIVAWLVIVAALMSGAVAAGGGSFTSEVEFTFGFDSQEAKDAFDEIRGPRPLSRRWSLATSS